MSASSPLFRFVQFELPWQLGPPDGRYLLRPPSNPDAPAAHVIVLVMLGAPERRRLAPRRRQAPPEPEPTPVTTTRVTIVDVGRPLEDPDQAARWLDRAGDAELDEGIEILNRALHAFRLATSDPYLGPVTRRQAIVARVGFGAGEQVADGLWTDARELVQAEGRQRRVQVLSPQARLAAVLGSREQPLVCEELALRARLDLEHRRSREAALQVVVALDAAVAELSADPAAEVLAERIDELRAQREPVAASAQAALAGPLTEPQLERIVFALQRIESALRARAVNSA